MKIKLQLVALAGILTPGFKSSPLFLRADGAAALLHQALVRGCEITQFFP